MVAVSLTSKHQITIPSEVRRSLNLQKGDRLSFDLAADGSCVVRKLALQKSDGAAKAYLEKRAKPLSRGKPISDAQMRAAIKKGAMETYQRRNG